MPESVFVALVAHVGASLDTRVSVRFETRASGPLPGEEDPFAMDEADVGFLCAPSYLWLASLPIRSVDLIPCAPVYDDPRAAGRPVYFSDVICGVRERATTFAGLRGRTFACNDPASLSGSLSMFAHLRDSGAGDDFFERVVWSGSHLASIQRVRRGEIAAAAIDSTVLRRASREDPSLASEVRVLESWGPFPVQPVVVRRKVAAETKTALAAALSAACESSTRGVRDALAAAGLVGFAPVTEAFYEAARSMAHPGDTERLAADRASEEL